jgi:hypothetical protein
MKKQLKTIGIFSENDLRREARNYLQFLLSIFTLAIEHLQRKELSFQIVDNLLLSDIYSESEIHPELTARVDLGRLQIMVKKLNVICDTPSHFNDFIYYSKLESIWDVSLDKFFTNLGDLYIKKIDKLADELVINNFEEYWYILLETKSLSQIDDFFGNRENSIRTQRQICSFYYFLMTNVRDNFSDEEIRVEIVWENGDRGTLSGWTTKTSTGKTFDFRAPSSKTDTTLQQLIELLERKISTFYSKITLSETKDSFIDGITKIISKRKTEHELLLFIENSFHFSDSVYTTKLQEHHLPNVMASKFATFLRSYFDKKQIEGVTKEDLILWLAFEFYGIRGFKYDNLKGYLERRFLTKNHKEAGNTIVKSFNKKIN